MAKQAFVKDNTGNWVPLITPAPDFTAYATTNYVDAQLALFDAFPSQSGNNGKYLTTDGTDVSWGTISFDGYATESYVDDAIADLVDTAPTTLDTLNELAQALGEDANFATTVTNTLAEKQDLIPYQSTAPTGVSVGDMWVDSSTTPPALKVYNGTTWVQLGSAVDDSQAILAGQIFG